MWRRVTRVDVASEPLATVVCACKGSCAVEFNEPDHAGKPCNTAALRWENTGGRRAA